MGDGRIEKRIEKYARYLQSQGPDEFPWGYYLWLAKEKMIEQGELVRDE